MLICGTLIFRESVGVVCAMIIMFLQGPVYFISSWKIKTLLCWLNVADAVHATLSSTIWVKNYINLKDALYVHLIPAAAARICEGDISKAANPYLS